MRTLRGLWSRRATMTPLLLVTVAVVAGAVTTLGFAHAAGTSPRLVAPLVLIGIAALPASGRELAERRRGEIAVARLRGVHGAGLWLLVALEPLIVLVIGAVAGLAIGLVGARIAVAGWLDDASGGHHTLLDRTIWLVAPVAIVAGLVAVLSGAAGAVREPLSEQVRIAQRPRGLSTTAIFVSLLVFAGAAVALYRATNKSTAGDDLVVLAGPALLGLALGQLALWGLRLLARWSTTRTGRSSMPLFLAVRRLARTTGVADPMRLLVASGVVAGLALTGTHAVDGFSDSTARLAAGAPYQFHSKGSALDALLDSRRIDPQGHHVMAAMLVADSPDATQRQAYVDTSRYAAVVGPFLAGTPASGLDDSMVRLRSKEQPEVLTGDTMTVKIAGVRGYVSTEVAARLVHVAVDYLDQHNIISTATATFRLAPKATSGTAQVRLPGCSRACTPVDFQVSQEFVRVHQSNGNFEFEDFHLTLTELRLGATNLLDGSWFHSKDQSIGFGAPPPPPGSITQTGGSAAIYVPVGGIANFAPEGLRGALPAIATTGLRFSGKPAVQTAGGDVRNADLVAHATALPLVQAGGTLVDLPASLIGASPTVPSAKVLLLANSSTPKAMLAQLRSAYGAPTTLAGLTAKTRTEVIAAQAKVYVLMAGFCLLIALLVVGSWAGRQRLAQRQAVAGLRVVGIGQEQVRRAGRVELAVLAVTSVVASVIGTVVAVHGLLGHLPLVHRPPFAVPVDTAVTWWPLVLAAVVVVAAWWLLGSRAIRADAAPATLREGVTG